MNRISAGIGAAFILASTPAYAQDPVPVNLFVAHISYDKGNLRIGTPRKLTGDRGVSSQPSFTPDGNAILFIGRRDSANAQTDVYRIDLVTGAETRITSTPEMENSPTVTPDGRLMVIRWVPSTLFAEWGPWIYDMGGKPLEGVLPGPDTVGYYVRVDSVTFAMMRPKSRPAVALFDVRARTMTDMDWPVATLPPQLIPRARAISYTRTDSLGRNQIRKLDLRSRRASLVAAALTGRVVHAWTPRGTLLMGKGNRVFAIAPGSDTAWRVVASFTHPELQSVTTYTVSPRGDRLIIISPVKPSMHLAIRDSLQAGRTMTASLAPYAGLDAAALSARLEISESGLIALVNEPFVRSSPHDAISLLTRIAELRPFSYSAQMHLGLAYRAAGDEARASLSLKRSLELNPRVSTAERRDAERTEQLMTQISR